MPDAPYALALAAGVLAAVNPCGFALLPAYLSLLVVGDPATAAVDPAGRVGAVRRALVLTVAMTTGFVLVFGVFGLLAAPVADLVAQRLPWLSIAAGLGLAALGAWLLTGRDLPVAKFSGGRGPAVSQRFTSMVIFGASYAFASLGCTIGPFLAVVVTAFRAESPATGVALFLTYALGMALIVGVAALAVALARMSLVRRLRRAAGAISRIGGALLVASGLYVAWYGWYELRLLRGGHADDPVVDGAAHVQMGISRFVSWLGPATLAIALGALIGGSAVMALRRRRRVRAVGGSGIGDPPTGREPR
jgi:cytochrome c-type biogenesis protein